MVFQKIEQLVIHLCYALVQVTPQSFYSLIVHRTASNCTTTIQSTIPKHVTCNHIIFHSIVTSYTRRQAVFWYSIGKILIYCAGLIVHTAFQINYESAVTINSSMCNEVPSDKFVMAICMKGLKMAVLTVSIQITTYTTKYKHTNIQLIGGHIWMLSLPDSLPWMSKVLCWQEYLIGDKPPTMYMSFSQAHLKIFE